MLNDLIPSKARQKTMFFAAMLPFDLSDKEQERDTLNTCYESMIDALDNDKITFADKSAEANFMSLLSVIYAKAAHAS